MKKHLKYILPLLFLCIPAILPLLKPGFFESHDGNWMIIRFSAFHQSLVDGHFPVRWSGRLNHGYGYPALNFLYPLPFWLAEFFYIFTNSFVLSIKLVFLSSFIFSAVFMYWFLKNRFSHLSSLAGALLYIYTPYRFMDTYIRGSIGESLGFVFIPLIFLSINLFKKHPRRAFVLGSLSLALTVLSHNVFIVFAVLAFIYGLTTLPSKYYLRLILMSLTGACLSCFFWFPALNELKFTYASTLRVANPTEYLVNLKQLIIPQSPKVMSYQIGLVNIVAVLISVKLWLKKRQKSILFFALTFTIVTLLMHQISRPFWQLPTIGIIQFPWRLLSITTFTSAFLLATLKKPALPLAIVAIATTLIYTQPSTRTHLPDSFYSTNEDTTTVQGEYTPIWVKKPPTQRPKEPYQIVQGQAEVTNYLQTNISKSLKIKSGSDGSTIKLASLYYPGWQLTVNDSKSPIKYSQYDGHIAFDVPKGDSQVRVFWQETPLRHIANSISLAALISLGVYSLTLLINKKSSKIYS